jgi:hypothetical protein
MRLIQRKKEGRRQRGADEILSETLETKYRAASIGAREGFILCDEVTSPETNTCASYWEKYVQTFEIRKVGRLTPGDFPDVRERLDKRLNAMLHEVPLYRRAAPHPKAETATRWEITSVPVVKCAQAWVDPGSLGAGCLFASYRVPRFKIVGKLGEAITIKRRHQISPR